MKYTSMCNLFRLKTRLAPRAALQKYRNMLIEALSFPSFCRGFAFDYYGRCITGGLCIRGTPSERFYPESSTGCIALSLRGFPPEHLMRGYIYPFPACAGHAVYLLFLLPSWVSGEGGLVEGYRKSLPMLSVEFSWKEALYTIVREC